MYDGGAKIQRSRRYENKAVTGNNQIRIRRLQKIGATTLRCFSWRDFFDSEKIALSGLPQKNDNNLGDGARLIPKRRRRRTMGLEIEKGGKFKERKEKDIERGQKHVERHGKELDAKRERGQKQFERTSKEEIEKGPSCGEGTDQAVAKRY